jgi:hypothetical protein
VIKNEKCKIDPPPLKLWRAMNVKGGTIPIPKILIPITPDVQPADLQTQDDMNS